MTDTCESRKTTGGHKPLPEFEGPPVVEVAVSVQFDAPVLDGPLIALRWGQVRDRFPLREETSPLTPTIETFGYLKSLGSKFSSAVPLLPNGF